MTLLASFDWATIWDNRGTLSEGLWRTIQVSAIGIVGATVIGIVLGAVRANRIPVLTQFAAAYVEVIRGGVSIAISTPVQPQDDPATSVVEGLVEVNHPGGGCWSTATGTPDIKPGDKIRVFQEQKRAARAG